MKRKYPVEYAAFCFEAFGRVKGHKMMASDEVYELWEKIYIKAYHPTLQGFDKWWYDTGSGLYPIKGHDHEQHAQRIARCAWIEAIDGANDK